MLNCAFDKLAEESEKCSPKLAGKVGKLTSEGWVCTIGGSRWVFPTGGPARKVSEDAFSMSVAEPKDTTNTNEARKLTAKAAAPPTKVSVPIKAPRVSKPQKTGDNVSAKGESGPQLELSRNENSLKSQSRNRWRISTPKTPQLTSTPLPTHPKPILNAVKQLPRQPDKKDLLKSQRSTKRSLPKFGKIEKKWTTMVGGDLWVFPPRAPARKLLPEEVAMLERSGLQKPSPSQPITRPKKMTQPPASQKIPCSALQRAPKRSLEPFTNTIERKKAKRMIPLKSKIPKDPVTKLPLIKKTKAEITLERSVGVGATSNGWVCKIGNIHWIFPTNAPARKLTPNEMELITKLPKSAAPSTRSNQKKDREASTRPTPSVVKTRPPSLLVSKPGVHPSRSHLMRNNNEGPSNSGIQNRSINSTNSRGFNSAFIGSPRQKSTSSRNPKWSLSEPNGFKKPSWNTSPAQNQQKPAWSRPKSTPSWNTDVSLNSKLDWNSSGPSTRGWEGFDSNNGWGSQSSSNRKHSSIDQHRGGSWRQ